MAGCKVYGVVRSGYGGLIMKWFKHLSTARNDEKIARLEDKCGLEGYGFYFKMLELVAESVDQTDRFEVTYSISRWGRQVNISSKKWLYLSQCCADVGLMLVCRCNDDVTVKIPNLLKHRDNHTKNLQVTCKQEKEKEKEVEIDKDTYLLIAGEREDHDAKNKLALDDSMRWVEFFVNEKGFRIHEAQTAKTVPMFVDWVARGVTIADVELAMITAHNFFGKDKAENPTGYRKFVNTVLIEKQKDQRLDYVNTNPKPSTGVSRKPSLVDQGLLSIARVEERERRERYDQLSVVS